MEFQKGRADQKKKEEEAILAEIESKMTIFEKQINLKK